MDALAGRQPPPALLVVDWRSGLRAGYPQLHLRGGVLQQPAPPVLLPRNPDAGEMHCPMPPPSAGHPDGRGQGCTGHAVGLSRHNLAHSDTTPLLPSGHVAHAVGAAPPCSPRLRLREWLRPARSVESLEPSPSCLFTQSGSGDFNQVGSSLYGPPSADIPVRAVGHPVAQHCGAPDLRLLSPLRLKVIVVGTSTLASACTTYFTVPCLSTSHLGRPARIRT